MKDYTLGELTKIIRDSFANYDKQGTKHWSWETTVKDLSYQIGSLNKVTLQISGERWAEGKNKDALEAAFRDELADILAEVLYIASERDIDMNQAIEAMVKSDHQKVADRIK